MPRVRPAELRLELGQGGAPLPLRKTAGQKSVILTECNEEKDPEPLEGRVHRPRAGLPH